MLAVSWLRSLSVIFSDTSVEVPTFSCDVLIESSPVRELGRVRLVSVPEGLSPCLNLYVFNPESHGGIEQDTGLDD